MALSETSCCRCVGGITFMTKYGKTKSGNQRYICKLCKKTRVENYIYQAYKSDTNKNIIQLTKEGLGILNALRTDGITDWVFQSIKTNQLQLSKCNPNQKQRNSKLA
ncbi:hypothetical protein [Flavobacterium sp. XS2P39]|uniref:hypothetical protein n=1 Tax=Flavobacterium sp. XS2P39 TaxID=3401725 RepID=UPI003AAFD094